MSDLKARIIINAQDNASSAFKIIESSVSNVKDRINQFMGLQLTSYLSNMVGSVKDAAESYQTLNARLKLVVTDSDEYAKAQKELFAIAQRSRAGLEGTIGLYTSISEKIKEMGGNSKQTAAVVETVNKAIALTSQGVQGDSAALLQFKQAINSATLAGDELKSILENSPGLARTMAEGLGVPVGALKAMGAAGQLTSEQVVNAMLKMQSSVDEKFNKIPLTIGQAITSVNNSWTQYIGKANEASNTTSKVANVIKASGDNLPQIISGLTTLGELYGVALVAKMGAFIGKTVESTVAKNAATAATQKVVVAETELIAAMAAGGTQSTRYKLAQQELSVAMTEGGAVTNSLAAKQTVLLNAQQAATAATTRLDVAQTALNAALVAGGADTARYAQAQAAEIAGKTNSQLVTQRLATAQADLNAEILANGATSQRAAVLQQELNATKLAATTAAQRLATAQAELNAAMLAGGAETQRYAAASAALATAQTAATATTVKLEAATAGLGVAAATTKASLLTMGNGFNVLLAAYAGWEVGSFLTKFESVRLAGTALAEGLTVLAVRSRYFLTGEFLKDGASDALTKEIEAIRKSYGEIATAALDSSKAAQASTAAQIEATKAQALATQESTKVTLEKLKETSTAIDAHYKLENDLIKQNLLIQTESIKSTSADAIKKETDITKATIDASKEQLANLEEAAAQKRTLVNEVYQNAIEKAAKDNTAKKEFEKDYLESSKQIYGELLNSYSQTVSQMIGAAQAHRDKAAGYAQDILNAEIRRHNGLIELERIGMNDAQLKASRKKELEQGVSDFKKAMAKGDFAEAEKIAGKNEKLAFELAKSEIDGHGRVTTSAKSKYGEIFNQSKTVAERLKVIQEQQATDAENHFQAQVEKMSDLKSRIGEIDAALAKGHQLKISVDNSAPEAAVRQNIQPTSSTHTIYVKTIKEPNGYSVGGEIQHFATGGTPNFVRREGGLGGFGGGDTVPAMLEPGEWIIKKESVAKYGNGFMAKLNAGKIDNIPRFATGGQVGVQHLSSGGEVQKIQPSSNQTITIKFELPNGKTAQGNFSQNDSANLISILQEAAMRGLPANIG